MTLKDVFEREEKVERETDYEIRMGMGRGQGWEREKDVVQMAHFIALIVSIALFTRMQQPSYSPYSS